MSALGGSTDDIECSVHQAKLKWKYSRENGERASEIWKWFSLFALSWFPQIYCEIYHKEVGICVCNNKNKV